MLPSSEKRLTVIHAPKSAKTVKHPKIPPNHANCIKHVSSQTAVAGVMDLHLVHPVLVHVRSFPIDQ
jgi:hypothetical protein